MVPLGYDSRGVFRMVPLGYESRGVFRMHELVPEIHVLLMTP